MYLLVDSNSIFKRIFYSIYKFKKDDEIDLDKLDDSEFYRAIIYLLHNLKYKFSIDRTDIILLYDQKIDDKYFRHDIYSSYKISRSKKDENSQILSSYYTKLLQTLQNSYLDHMYNSISHNYLEADDCAYIISQNILKPFIIMSYDKDFNQMVIRDRVNIYNPNLDSLLNEELSMFDYKHHIMFGDESDSIPSCFQHTNFNDNFITILNKYDIASDNILLVEGLSIFDKLKEEYSVEFNNGNIYSRSKFRIKRKEIHKYFDGYYEQIMNNKLLKSHYLRNQKLIDMSYIPKEYIKPVLTKFNSLTKKSFDKLDIENIKEHMKELELTDSPIYNFL